MIYKKLYKKIIDFPIILPPDASSNINSDYYILLEKNYIPIESTEHYIMTPEESSNWLRINLQTHDQYYNKLIVTSVSENTQPLKREVMCEFIANNINTNSTKQISQCNSVYCHFVQAPKEIIDAVITFIPLNDTQTIDSNNNLTINGDEQDIKIIYYGLNGDTKIVSSNQVSLKIQENGNYVDLNPSNIISKKITGNGIEIIYHINENNTINKNFVFKCTYNTEYNSITNTKTVTQIPNHYEIVLKINNSTNNLTINDYRQTQVNIEYYCKKNDVYITQGVQLLFSNIANTPVILHNESNTIITDGKLSKTSTIFLNPTNQNRMVQVQVTYNNLVSNIIKITQSSCNINNFNFYSAKYTDGNEIQTTNITVNGNEQDVKIKYYVSLNSIQYIQVSNIINGREVTEKLVPSLSSDSVATIVSDVSYNTSSPYKIITLHLPQNSTNNTRVNKLNIQFFNKTYVVTINQNAQQIILELNQDKTTTVTGGFNDEYNLITLTYIATVSDEKILDPNRYIVTLSSNANVTLYDNIVVNGYIQTRYKYIETYGYNNETSNITINYTIQHSNKTITGTITRKPVYFDLSLECTTITFDTENEYYPVNTGGQDAKLLYYGIIYNYQGDTHNYMLDLNLYPSDFIITTDNTLPAEVRTNILNNIHITGRTLKTNGVESTISFAKNDNNVNYHIYVKYSYKNKNKTITFYQTFSEIFVNLYINKYSIYNGTSYISQSIPRFTTKQIYINPFAKCNIQAVAELRDSDNNVLQMVNLGTYNESQINSTTNYKLEYTKTQNSITSYKDNITYDIEPNFGLNNNAINLNISYTPGDYKSTGDHQYITNNTILNIIKPKITGNLYSSFNFSNIITDYNISQSIRTVYIYFVYTFTNTYNNETYIDKIPTHYQLSFNGNNADNMSSYQMINSVSGPTFSTQYNKFYYTITLNQNIRVSSTEPYKIFNVNYINNHTPYYSITDNGVQLKLTQKNVNYSLEYNIPNITFDESTQRYELNSTDMSFELKIICKENGNIINTNQSSLISLALQNNSNLDINFTFNNFYGGVHTYICTFNNNQHKYEAFTDVKITWNGINEIFSVYQLGCNTFTVDLISSKTSVSQEGETITITYAAYADNIKTTGIKIENPNNNLKLSGKLNGSNVTFPSPSISDKNIFTTTYTFPPNTTSSTKSLTLIASYFDMLGDPDYEVNVATSLIVTQANQTTNLVVSINKTENLTGDNDSVTLTIYVLVNGTKLPLTKENYKNYISIAIDDPGHCIILPYNELVIVNNNIVYRTYSIDENITTNESLINAFKTVTFTVSYINSDLSETRTYRQKYKILKCILTSEDTDFNVGPDGKTVKLHYYGLIINTNTRVTDKNIITLKCDNIENLPQPYVSNNELICNVTIPPNEEETQTYTFYAEYLYNEFNTIISNSITYTQTILNITLYFTVNNTLIIGNETIGFEYWAEDQHGNHIYDINKFNIRNYIINDRQTIQGTFGDPFIQTTTRTIKRNFQPISQPNVTNYSNFILTYTDTENDIELTKNIIVIQNNTAGAIRQSVNNYDFLILNYIPDNPNNLSECDVTNYRNSEQLTNVNSYAGTGLQTITNISANAPIYVNIGNTRKDLCLIKFGHEQTINNDTNNPYLNYIRFSGHSNINSYESLLFNFKNIQNIITEDIYEIVFNIHANWALTRSKGKVNIEMNYYSGNANDITIVNNKFNTNKTLIDSHTYNNIVFDVNGDTENILTYSTLLKLYYYPEIKQCVLYKQPDGGANAFNIFVLAPEPFSIFTNDDFDITLNIEYDPANYILLDWTSSIYQIYKKDTYPNSYGNYTQSLTNYMINSGISIVDNGGLIVTEEDTNIFKINYDDTNIGNTYDIKFGYKYINSNNIIDTQIFYINFYVAQNQEIIDNLILFIDIDPEERYDGNECDIIVKLYISSNNTLYPLPASVPLQKDNVSWLTQVGSSYVENNKLCYKFHVEENITTDPIFDVTRKRICTFNYTYYGQSISKQFLQSYNIITCELEYTLENN